MRMLQLWAPLDRLDTGPLHVFEGRPGRQVLEHRLDGVAGELGVDRCVPVDREVADLERRTGLRHQPCPETHTAANQVTAHSRGRQCGRDRDVIW
jgi:hypothetical protein